MTVAQIGYLVGLLTTLGMVVVAITADIRGVDRADDIRTHAFFAGLGAAAVIITHRRYGGRTLWVLLVSACVCYWAGQRGLEWFWLFLAGYAVAGGIGLWVVWTVPSDAVE